jgi:hypothetical protein
VELDGRGASWRLSEGQRLEPLRVVLRVIVALCWSKDVLSDFP